MIGKTELSRRGTAARARVRLVFALVAALLCVANGPARADNPGETSITYAGINSRHGTYLLDVLVNYQISRALKEALTSGVHLELVIRAEVLRENAWLPDTAIVEKEFRFRLHYNALLEKYLVKNENNGDLESFSDLAAALRYSGKLLNAKLLSASRLEPEETYYCQVRAMLDQAGLSLPLRMVAFIKPVWRIKTDWYVLPLR
ncbi:MAG: DUF4390 domain-containing protein [Pseudomonadota bacterium]|nr:DUF4390 domain-containing protein [Pseudomonadota bacterium]